MYVGSPLHSLVLLYRTNGSGIIVPTQLHLMTWQEPAMPDSECWNIIACLEEILCWVALTIKRLFGVIQLQVQHVITRKCSLNRVTVLWLWLVSPNGTKFKWSSCWLSHWSLTAVLQGLHWPTEIYSDLPLMAISMVHHYITSLWQSCWGLCVAM